MKSEKKVLGVLISKFETHAKYTWVADEEQKKKILGVLRGKLLVLILEKGQFEKRVWETLAWIIFLFVLQAKF